MSITTLIDRLAFLQGLDEPSQEDLDEMDNIEDEIECFNDDDTIQRHGVEW